VMKETQGKANPQSVNEILKRLLSWSYRIYIARASAI
jgi:hypothetical protein